MKEAMQARRGEGRGPRGEGKGHGRRGHGMGPQGEFGKRLIEKFDTNKDGQLDDSEKQAMKEAMQARRAEMEKGGRGPGAHNKRGHWQGPRTKMPRNPKDKPKDAPADKPTTLEIPQV